MNRLIPNSASRNEIYDTQMIPLCVDLYLCMRSLIDTHIQISLALIIDLLMIPNPIPKYSKKRKHLIPK